MPLGPESPEIAKEAAARFAVDQIGIERRIALGTGSTAAWAVRALAERFPGAPGFTFVASSRATEDLAKDLDLPVRALREDDRFDLMIDGADEVSTALDLTKGGGGALFREKFLAQLSHRLVIIVDEGKLVDHLGTRHPIPIEVVPFARPVVANELAAEGWTVRLRGGASGPPFRTDNGNEVLDLMPRQPLSDPRATHEALRSHTGVVETGIFAGMAERVLIGHPDGRVEERRRPDIAHRQD
ncbi:MAG: ribose-5-phosphate isomerase RpiA [Thermoplasmatales archaeon]|nr:ribose-5-phosphate isomerase RpiA [Thermoplasmatales archaeon]